MSWPILQSVKEVTYYIKWVTTILDFFLLKSSEISFHINGLPAERRTQPTTKKAKISSTTHVQMLQWLHGKQQQQANPFMKLPGFIYTLIF